ncbi:unnamed protein product [Meloidogyne enterolobii]|uniref:Uncharacterized protein n=1 Tax=Meloidogyne enterolobii TaxID=390850 RepID=A0ACB0ZEM9_MELEN
MAILTYNEVYHLGLSKNEVRLQKIFFKSRTLCPFHYDEQQHKSTNLNGDFVFKYFLMNLKEFQLRTDELRDLQDFEEDCMDDLARRKFRLKDNNCPERRRNSDRHCFSDFSSCNRELLVQLQKMQAKIDKLEQKQEKLFEKFVERQNKKCRQEQQLTENRKNKKEGKLNNKKEIPKAKVLPMTLNNEELNILEEEQQISIPQILIPEEEEDREESSDSSGHSNQSYENEENLVEGMEIERENEGNNGQQQPQQGHLNIIDDNRQRNYSVSLSEDLEQMFGMLRM